MKIQFAEKGDVSWDVLVEKLGAEELHDDHHHTPSCKERFLRQCCMGSWQALAIVVTVVSFTQIWLLFYLISTFRAAGPTTHLVYIDDLGNERHIHFSWSNCGSASDPVQLKQLQVTPDPVLINGNITLTLNAYLDRFLDEPISASVKVERKMGWFWVKIPCLENLGSCNYKDVCQLSPFVAPEPCPDPFPRFGLPCRCPVKKGQYKVRGGVFSIPELIKYIPAWLVSGDYYIHATAQKKGVSLGCYNLYVSVSY